MFVVTVTIEVHPGHWRDFLPLVMENARASVSEPACQRFDVATDPDRPGEVFLYELYDDASGFDAHRKTPHYATFDRGTADMIRRKSVVTYSEFHA
ncbi:putative quinol monooxygenase [Jannaschia rubra]|uniref:Autoinducer 2-degrading protein LsrG n=1 Tax=Jannaschia rubra TaxID=282197 RepID=A0A0M6XP60_9RHOB|nr:putative quinol monooxygenase [Jannaschia rubra]CTQ32387.1 Autoinducer 2-degrading protein LsrG [Jannaschia rubra]SFG45593.1 autoinducer 2-degrading protein [Jannaschia rubra]